MADDRDNKRELQNLEKNSVDSAREMLGLQNRILETMHQRNLTEELFLAMNKKGNKLTEKEYETIVKTHMEQRESLDTMSKQLSQQRKSIRNLMDWQKLQYKITSGFNSYVEYLMTADSAIKNIALEFGQAGGRADDMRISIEDSAIGAARLGMKVEELASMYKGYVDQVGRTVTMNKDQMEAMAALAKGTGLAAEGAAELAGHMEMMGRDAISVNKQVEGILETSERMGVNATKVLKAVSANFKKLQTYTFRTGVQGMGDMAAYAEKFKIDIDTALSAAEKSRRLEGAVELAAQLQVLGGEFAKSDPFEMLFLSRNDPAKFQTKIAELTKGMATLNKVGDDFEFQLASPMARDLLENAGKALGISTEKMTEMALQQAKLNKMRNEMFNAGYTKEQKEIVTGLAQMDSSTGKFFVNVKGARRDIADLTKTELSYLDKQSLSLKERAKNAQTFDDQFKIFMLELKAVGLPLLQGINAVLNDHIRPVMDTMSEWMKSFSSSTKDIMGKIGGGVALLLLLKPLLGPLGGIASMIGRGGVGLVTKLMRGGKKAPTGVVGSIGKTASKGGGLSALGKGAGVGLAAAGMGAGVMMASKGIASIADSISNLDDKQMEYLKYILIGMPVAMIAMAATGQFLGTGLMIATGAVIGFGLGLRMAGEGIVMMSEGLATLIPVAAESSGSLLEVAGGILAINAALVVGGAGSILGVVGAGTLKLGLMAISSEADGIAKVGTGFEKISMALNSGIGNYKEVRDTVDAIASADFSNLNALNNLSSLFDKPLQVEFADKEIGMVANITLEIDGEKLVDNLGIYENVSIRTKILQNGGVS